MSLNLVLASGSPRRRELLNSAGYNFRVIVPDESVESSIDRNLSPERFVSEASFQKAKAISRLLTDEIVVAADTVAVCDGQILGKPENRDHARKMLMSLQGTRHFVLTGTTVWNCSNGRFVTDVDKSELEMEDIGEVELIAYLDGGGWNGKAGAFGYQDGLDWVSIVSGLESNVVGLPIEKLPNLIAMVAG